MLMMLPPPARRSSGTPNLHMRNAPVRLTAIALFHWSRVNVSTEPSGVTVAATLTKVVSLPKCATARVTPCFALASSDTSTASACARPPLSPIARAAASALAGSRSATATSAPSAANSREMAPPISPPPPLTSATRPVSLVPVAISMRRLDEAAINDRRLGGIGRLDQTDLREAIGHLAIDGVRYIAFEAEQLQLGDQVFVGLGRVLRILLGALHQNVDGLLLLAGS